MRAPLFRLPSERYGPVLPWSAAASRLSAGSPQRGLAMTSAASRIRVLEQEGVLRIEFVDRNILDEANIQQIGEEISQLVEMKLQPKVLISFDNVDHLSSAALGTLITINNKIRGTPTSMAAAPTVRAAAGPATNAPPQCHRWRCWTAASKRPALIVRSFSAPCSRCRGRPRGRVMRRPRS